MATGPNKLVARSRPSRRGLALAAGGACFAGWLTLGAPAIAQVPPEPPQTTVRIVPPEPSQVPRPPQYAAPDTVPEVTTAAPRRHGPPQFILAEIEAAGASFDPNSPPPDVSNLRERVLLPMVMQERMLLVDLGPRHPQILAIRARIEALEEYLRQQGAVQAAQAALAEQAKEEAAAETARKEREAAADRAARERERKAAERLAAEATPVKTDGGEWDGGWPRIPETQPAPRNIHPVGADAIDEPAQDRASTDDRERDATHRHAGGMQTAGPPSGEKHSIFDSIVLPFVSIVAACIVGLLLHAAAFMYFLRRHGAKLSPLFRVELVGGELSAKSPSPARGHGIDTTVGGGFNFPLAPPPAEDEEEDLGPVDTLKLFDPGPSFEEERQMKEEAARQQEEAVLRNIFEQNLTLREQISNLQPDAA